jgi:RNA polymerase-binding transcription factor DksA
MTVTGSEAWEIQPALQKRGRLAAVRAALRRAHGDTFGVCNRCEAAINPRCLAVPWAQLSIQCLETAESNRRRTAGSAGEAL